MNDGNKTLIFLAYACIHQYFAYNFIVIEILKERIEYLAITRKFLISIVSDSYRWKQHCRRFRQEPLFGPEMKEEIGH